MIRHAAESFWRMQRGTRMDTNMIEVMANNEIQSSGRKAEELHAGHLEAIGFMKGRDTVEHFRRYDAHLQRTFDKSMKRLQEMASLRTKEQKEKEPLPPSPPVRKQVNPTLKEAVLKLPLPKNNPITPLGTVINAIKLAS